MAITAIAVTAAAVMSVVDEPFCDPPEEGENVLWLGRGFKG